MGGVMVCIKKSTMSVYEIRKRQHRHHANERCIIVFKNWYYQLLDGNLFRIPCSIRTYVFCKISFMISSFQICKPWRHVFFSPDVTISNIENVTTHNAYNNFSTSQLNIHDVGAWYTASNLHTATRTNHNLKPNTQEWMI